MTPDTLNECVAEIVKAMNLSPNIGTVQDGIPADEFGTLPEIYADVNGQDLCLVVSPL